MCFLIPHTPHTHTHTHTLGSETVKHSGQVGLYAENPGFWFGTHGRHHVHDDAVCGDAVLSGARGDPWHGLQRERGHLVSRLHYGRDDSRRCPVSRHGSYRSVEQDYR